MEGFAYFIKRQELIQELSNMGLNPESYDLDKILNEFNLLKKFSSALMPLRKALLPMVLAASPFISGAKHMEIPDNQPQPYKYTVQRSYENQDFTKARQDDKNYIAAGGPRFEGSVDDAKEFINFKNSKEHKNILKKAGLNDNYIPSSIKEFVFGSEISSVHKNYDMSGRIEDFKTGIVKGLGRESSVEIIKSKNLKDGGAFISANISGVIMAMDQKDAERRLESQIENIIRANGFELNGMSVRVHREFTHVEPAQRSTIDYTQAQEWYVESNGGEKFNYNVEVDFTIKPN